MNLKYPFKIYKFNIKYNLIQLWQYLKQCTLIPYNNNVFTDMWIKIETILNICGCVRQSSVIRGAILHWRNIFARFMSTHLSFSYCCTYCISVLQHCNLVGKASAAATTKMKNKKKKKKKKKRNWKKRVYIKRHGFIRYLYLTYFPSSLTHTAYNYIHLLHLLTIRVE